MLREGREGRGGRQGRGWGREGRGGGRGRLGGSEAGREGGGAGTAPHTVLPAPCLLTIVSLGLLGELGLVDLVLPVGHPAAAGGSLHCTRAGEERCRA